MVAAFAKLRPSVFERLINQLFNFALDALARTAALRLDDLSDFIARSESGAFAASRLMKSVHVLVCIASPTATYSASRIVVLARARLRMWNTTRRASSR